MVPRDANLERQAEHLLLGAMVVIFALLGYVNVRCTASILEQNTLQAERVSDVIKHGTNDYMLRNDREGLYHSIQRMAAEPGIEKIRSSTGRPGHLHHQFRRTKPGGR